MEQSSRQASHRVLVGLALVAVLLALWIVRPFWKALLLGAILAGILRGAMERTVRAFRGRRALAAFLITLGALVVLLAPVAGFGAIVIQQIVQGTEWIMRVLESEGAHGLVKRLPGPLADAVRSAAQALPSLPLEIERFLTTGGKAAAAVGGAVAATSSLLLRALLMLVALFFFLTDGHRLTSWLETNLPMRHGQLRRLLEEFRRTSRSVVLATLGTAVIQALVAGVGFFIARAPVPVFLVLLTLAIALVPAVGGGSVVVLVGIFQIVAGHWISGVFLVAWGIGAVGLVDNFARPYLLKGGMELPGGVVFFALLGGIAAFGGIGLVVGPLVVTFLIAVMKLLQEDLREMQAR